MKRSYSYFIVKPDGIRYLDEILEDLEGKFQEIKYLNAIIISLVIIFY